MKILQRLKDGASKATEKAQNVVEINKMNSQIAEIERQKNAYFKEMGKVFYEGYRSQDMSIAEKEMVELAQLCDGLQEEVITLRNRIAVLKNERLCECGRVVGLDANFCPYCGNKLEKLPQTERQFEPEQKERVIPFEDDHEEDAAVKERFEYGSLSEQPESEQEHDPEVEIDPEQLLREEEERERERRHLEELERERQRQLELDRRIRFWQENNQFQDQKPTEESQDTVKCQICSVDLAKGSKWCPRCGAEQI